MLALRYVFLLVATAGGGILSGFLWLVPNGIMAGLMAFSFSLGTIWLAEKERRRPGAVKLPDALFAGATSGLLAGMPLLIIARANTRVKGGELDFLNPAEWSTLAVFLIAVMYGMVLHGSYFRRKSAKRPRVRVLASATIGFFLIKLGAELLRGTEPFLALLWALFGAVPFAILWVVITAAVDPAWRGACKRSSDSEPSPPGDAVIQADTRALG